MVSLETPGIDMVKKRWVKVTEMKINDNAEAGESVGCWIAVQNEITVFVIRGSETEALN